MQQIDEPKMTGKIIVQIFLKMDYIFTVFTVYHHDHTTDSLYTEHLNAIFQQ